MNPDLEKIREIGMKIRQVCLEKYKKRFSSSLAECCAIASGRLYKELVKEGFKPVIVETTYPIDNQYGHCYILVNGYVLDVTATQFGQSEPVCFFEYGIHKTEKEKFDFWYWYSDKQRYFNSLKELRNEQFKNNWPWEQIYWSDKYCNGY
jgi:hypothetical protein